MGHGTNSGRTLPGNARQFVPHELDIPRGVTEAQKRVLNNAKRIIDNARTKSFEEWCKVDSNADLERIRVWYRNDDAGYERRVAQLRGWYEEARSGIALVTASGPTIYKLERLGLIKIINDTTGDRRGSYAADTIKLLNY